MPPATGRAERRVPPTPDAIRVMIVDDSAVIRAALSRLLAGEPDIRVVARAADGRQALEALAASRLAMPVDIVLLDIAMPVLDGLAALPLLLDALPGLTVVIASTLSVRGAEATLQALRLGAADFIAKPSAAGIQGAEFRSELLAKLRSLGRRRAAVRPAGSERIPAPEDQPVAAPVVAPMARRPLLVAIGSSTGGPQALMTLIAGLGPSLSVPVVVAQHMPASLTRSLAAHLDRLGVMPCCEAEHGQSLAPGHLYLGPGGQHLLIAGGPALQARLCHAPSGDACRPSVDVMLRSAAVACNGRVLAVMLTGMGQDGLVGTQAVITAGGMALAQDEASSVVWGMPGAVAQAGLCQAVLPLTALGSYIRGLTTGTASKASG